jgi:hypothetical protein
MEAACPMHKGGHIAADVLHGIIDSHAGSDRTAGGIDVKGDVLVRIFGLKKQSWATTTLATSSLTWLPRKMIRSFSSRE